FSASIGGPAVRIGGPRLRAGHRGDSERQRLGRRSRVEGDQGGRRGRGCPGRGQVRSFWDASRRGRDGPGRPGPGARRDRAVAGGAGEEGSMSEASEARQFDGLLEYLKRSRGFDFSAYKRTSLMRRVRKRMDTVKIESFSDYTDFLEVHPDEFAHLFAILLINVTSFFRDETHWDVM